MHRHFKFLLVLMGVICLVVLGATAARAADEIERLVVVYLDKSGSMDGDRDECAETLLESCRREWESCPNVCVVAMPFSSSHAVVALGSPGARVRLERIPALTGRVRYASDPAALVRALAEVPCRGGTRLYGTILDTATPLVEAFPEADLTLQVITDGNDSDPPPGLQEPCLRELRNLLVSKGTTRVVDVLLMRWEKANEPLMQMAEDASRATDGRVRVNVSELADDAPPSPGIEAPGEVLPLSLDAETGMLLTPQFQVDLLNVTTQQPLVVVLVEGDGIDGAVASVEALMPGSNAVWLVLTPNSEARSTFWSDRHLSARVQLQSGPGVTEVAVGAVLPAAWRVFQQDAAFVALAAALLVGTIGWFALRHTRRAAARPTPRHLPLRSSSQGRGSAAAPPVSART